MSDPVSWPVDLAPHRATLAVATLSAVFDDPLSAAAQLRARPYDPAGARLAAIAGVDGLLRSADLWVAELWFDLDAPAAAWLDGVIARLRGPAGRVRIPAWTVRPTPAGTLAGMDGYAAAVGPTRFDDATGFSDGGAFFEGAGTPRVAGGRGHRLTLEGFWPFAGGVLAEGDAVGVGPGRVHVVGAAGATDLNGRVTVWLAPTVRSPVPRGPLETAGLTVEVRPTGDDIGAGATRPPRRTRRRLALVEVVS